MPETGDTIYVYRYADDVDEFVGPYVMEVAEVDPPYLTARRTGCENSMGVLLYSDEGRWLPRQSGVLYWLSDSANGPAEAVPPKDPDRVSW